MGVSAVLWIAFAKLVVPPIIESAYRGESLSLLNSIIEGHKFHPVEFYLTIWDGITVRGVVVLVTVWLLAAVVGSAAFFYRSVGGRIHSFCVGRGDLVHHPGYAASALIHNF